MVGIARRSDHAYPFIRNTCWKKSLAIVTILRSFSLVTTWKAKFASTSSTTVVTMGIVHVHRVLEDFLPAPITCYKRFSARWKKRMRDRSIWNIIHDSWYHQEDLLQTLWHEQYYDGSTQQNCSSQRHEHDNRIFIFLIKMGGRRRVHQKRLHLLWVQSQVAFLLQHLTISWVSKNAQKVDPNCCPPSTDCGRWHLDESWYQPSTGCPISNHSPTDSSLLARVTVYRFPKAWHSQPSRILARVHLT